MLLPGLTQGWFHNITGLAFLDAILNKLFGMKLFWKDLLMQARQMKGLKKYETWFLTCYSIYTF